MADPLKLVNLDEAPSKWKAPTGPPTYRLPGFLIIALKEGAVKTLTAGL
jgi:hypothetical protein